MKNMRVTEMTEARQNVHWQLFMLHIIKNNTAETQETEFLSLQIIDFLTQSHKQCQLFFKQAECIELGSWNSKMKNVGVFSS